MIELVGIHKKYDRVVLNNVNLTLNKGNIYVIKGISGSGKTTLFNILSFLDTDYSGDYLWNGQNVKNISAEKKEEYFNKVSYVFQKSFLFRGLTIKENLLFIKNNIELIEKYSNMFHISSLLDKKPEEISGGERQRVALVRALILDSEVILLDEPTSSLDKENSLLFVSYLKKLKLENKIIVISTHKEIYDDMADYIYSIDFGVLTLSNKHEKRKGLPKEDRKEFSSSSNTFKEDFHFAIERKQKRVMLTFVVFLFFLLIFSFLAIIFNIKYEAVSWKSEELPLNVFDISKEDKDAIIPVIHKTYYNYKIVAEEYNGYVLLDREDSSFLKFDILKYGSFPKTENEVVINKEFAIEILKTPVLSDAIGKEILICDQVFVVSAVIVTDNSVDTRVYRTNSFYNEIYDFSSDNIKPAVFIPYDKIHTIAEIDDSTDRIIISISMEDAISIYINEMSLVDGYGDYSYYLTWNNILRDFYSSLYNYTLIALGIVIVAVIFIFIFIQNKISLELYYKKKEIGYLRLYRVSNDRIHFIFLIDYLLEVLLAYILSVVIFHVLCLYVYIRYHASFFLPIHIWFIVTFIFFIYFYLLVSIPVLKYTKKDILSCISNS